MKYMMHYFLVFSFLVVCNQPVFAATGSSAASSSAVSSETKRSGVKITSLDHKLVDGVYLMNVDLEFVLSEEMLEALNRGVPLVYLLSLRVLKPRFGWLNRIFKTQSFNKHIYSVEKRYELRYHALSRQYLVTDLEASEQISFYTLRSAFEYLGTIRDLPLLNETIMNISDQLYAQVKVKLDIDSLPVPLKVRAYTRKSWRLKKTRWQDWLP